MRAAIVIAACLAVASGKSTKCSSFCETDAKLLINELSSQGKAKISKSNPSARASDLTITSPARTFSKKALSTPLARGGGRIVGGTDAYPGEFPHQVRLR